jgi:hypothetical protein
VHDLAIAESIVAKVDETAAGRALSLKSMEVEEAA